MTLAVILVIKFAWVVQCEHYPPYILLCQSRLWDSALHTKLSMSFNVCHQKLTQNIFFLFENPTKKRTAKLASGAPLTTRSAATSSCLPRLFRRSLNVDIQPRRRCIVQQREGHPSGDCRVFLSSACVYPAPTLIRSPDIIAGCLGI